MTAYSPDAPQAANPREPLHLWFAKPHLIGAGEGRENVLSNEERLRWKTFRFEKDRRQYLATRLLVRYALSHYEPLPPESWQFQANAYGKPTVKPDRGLHFNLSNSPDLVVCVLGSVELGIDAEPHARAAEIFALGSEFLSPREIAQLDLCGKEERLDRAMSLWTLKEAYVKARGLGFSLPLKQFSFLCDTAGDLQLETEDGLDLQPSNWRFCLLNLAQHRVSIVVRTQTLPELQLWQADSPAAPKLVSGGAVQWHPR